MEYWEDRHLRKYNEEVQIDREPLSAYQLLNILKESGHIPVGASDQNINGDHRSYCEAEMGKTAKPVS